MFLGTHAENMRDAARKRRFPRGRRAPAAKLSDRDIVAILSEPYRYGVNKMLAQRHGVAKEYISALRARTVRADVRYDQPVQTGPSRWADLSDDDVRAIRAAPAVRGLAMRLAEQYNVSHHTIRRIRSGRTHAGV